MQSVPYSNSSFLPFGSAPATVLRRTIDENTVGVVYGGGWSDDTASVYIDGHGRYSYAAGSYFETTVQAGESRVVFKGPGLTNDCVFDISKNGGIVGSGTGYAATATTGMVYADVANLVPGDTIRLTLTGPGAGGGTLLFADSIEFYG